MPTRKSGQSGPSESDKPDKVDKPSKADEAGKQSKSSKQGKKQQVRTDKLDSLDLDALDQDALGPEGEEMLESLASFFSSPILSTSAAAGSPPYDPRLMEEQLAAVSRVLAERDFDSVDEANAFLQTLLTSGDMPQVVAETPLEQAQQVIYDALRAKGKQRQKLARKALSISPDCADAYVLLAEGAKDIAEARSLYEQGVQAGERALGEEVFREDAGEFWGILETRPYMRARLGLAELLWGMDERQNAVAHATDLLRLNPEDNQGVRYILASWLLAIGDDAALTALLAQYPDEGSAQWAYTKALHAFRQSGAGRKADKALKEAMEANPYVPLYLLGLKEPPKQMPEYYGIGDESEAVIYIFEAIEGWVETEGALEWMADTMMRIAPSGPPTKPKRARRPKRPPDL